MFMDIPELKTDNLIITVLSPDDFHLIEQYQNNNIEHLSKWEPIRLKEYFSGAATKARVDNNYKEFLSGTSVSLVGLDKNRRRIICLCTFSNIVRGVFQACNLGYSINAEDQGKGIMFEMLQASIDHIFSEFGLHRIMANYIPTNIRSELILQRLGFQKEGLAKSYLKIAGSWQDHILTSKINPLHADSSS